MATKRASTVPVQKPPTKLDPKAIVSESASLTGKYLISIAQNAVIHPRSKLSSAAGPITIGENCIVNERALLGIDLKALKLESPGTVPEPGASVVELGSGVCIEIGCVIEAAYIGEGTVVEAGARLRRGCKIGKVLR
jgi:dynactin-6